jgi:hypothetical protein
VETATIGTPRTSISPRIQLGAVGMLRIPPGTFSSMIERLGIA